MRTTNFVSSPTCPALSGKTARRAREPHKFSDVRPPVAMQPLKMFSHIVNPTTISILTQSESHAHLPPYLADEQQLRAELARAIEDEMVSTRSKDHATPSDHVQELSANETPTATTKKRKAEYSLDVTPSKQGTKRGGKVPIIEDSTSVTESTHGNASTLSPKIIPLTPSANGSQGDAVPESVVSRPSRSLSKDVSFPSSNTSTTATGIDTSNNLLDRPSRAGKITMKQTKPRIERQAEVVTTVTSSAKPAKAIHKRFGSSDTDPSIQAPSSTTIDHPPVFTTSKSLINADVEASASDSDDAPETISATTGLTQARAALAEAAKVAKRYASPHRSLSTLLQGDTK